MEQGEDRSGCTLFHLDAGLDTGPVVEIGWSPIDYDRSFLWNFVQTYFAGTDTLMRHLPELEEGNPLAAAAQDQTERRYYGYPTEREFEAFVQKGGHIVLPEDYVEMLSGFLPGGMDDAHFPELRKLVSSLARETAKAHEIA